ncbi:MAG TPA: hypothetical protein VLA43_02495, partial [Longimicrobiales bacterium]|nr:hypothetical protein [Longimicrobiales bacterium]
VRRRKVGGTALGYLAVGFILLQVAEVVSIPGISQDDALRVVTGLLVAGFPLALVGSWLFDVSAGGITRTREEGLTAAGRGGQLAIQAVAIVLSLVLAGTLGWWFLAF